MGQVKKILAKVMHRHSKLTQAGRMRRGTGRNHWLSYLKFVTSNLNNRRNRIMKLSPKDARKKRNFDLVFRRLYGDWKWDQLLGSNKGKLLAVHDKVHLQLFYHKRGFYPFARTLELE